MRRVRVLGSLAVGVLGLCVLAGCAGIRVEPDSAEAVGVRYYQSSPYLLVTTDNEGGLTSQLVFLPNLGKKMSARPYAFCSKNDTTLDFDEGVLTSAVGEGDSTVGPKAVLAALEKVAGAAMKPAKSVGETRQKRVPGPVLYRIELNCSGGGTCLVGPDGRVPAGHEKDVYSGVPPAAASTGGGR